MAESQPPSQPLSQPPPSDQPKPRASGGRRAGAGTQRTWSPLVLAVVGVPVSVALVLGTLDLADLPDEQAKAPQRVPLASIDLVCPTPLGSSPSISVTQADVTPDSDAPEGEGSGRVVAGIGPDQAPMRVPIGTVVPAPRAQGPSVISGSGTSAPGLAASLTEERPRAATSCAVPESDLWFSGLGAGPTHGSVLELVNPDEANGVADITIYSEEGILDVPALRGIAVPGDSSIRLSLGEILPRRGQLAARVSVSRGRLGVSVTDRNDELGEGDVSTEWLPAQSVPSTSNLLLGLPDAGQHQLVIANPGADEAVVSVRVLTPAAPFVPTGVAQLQVPPESVGVLSLSDVISDAVGAEGPDGLGLIVEASAPVATSLRSLVAGDLSFTAPAQTLEQGWQLVPAVRSKDRALLVLWGGPEPTSGTVRLLDGSGATLVEREVTIAALAAEKVKLPPEAALVELVSGDGLAAAISLSGKRGSVVVALRQVLTSSLIPHVRPTLR